MILVPLNKLTDPDWFRDHENLAELYRDLRDRCEEPDDPAYFCEKPWKWSAEWQRMCAAQGHDGTPYEVAS